LLSLLLEDDETSSSELSGDIRRATHNSYLIPGQKHAVLLDTVKKPFTLDYLEALSSTIYLTNYLKAMSSKLKY